jgi:DNA (cytosine-5)-methyltransferase 1
MKVLDLFSGIGGFSLGLERAGMRTVAFCEIESFPRKVLAKHWPNVPIYDDVRTLTAERLAADGIAIDVICGGFPCQDISFAGNGAGLAGERSGLWREYARLISEIRPRYVIVENVAALLSRGLGDVLRDLAALGYDAEWHCIPASRVGARHRRDRAWIVAYAERRRLQGGDVECARTATVVAAAFGRYRRGREFGEAWRSEPDVGRVAYGIPDAMDRIKGLGNAVVPQIPELIGRAIIAATPEQGRVG